MDKQLERLISLKTRYPDNIGVQSFDHEYFQSLDTGLQARLMRCLRSGIENPDSEMGCYACHHSDYDDLKPFFSKVLSQFHQVGPQAHHRSSWDLSAIPGLLEHGQLDITRLGLPPLSMRIRTARNLSDFPLPGGMERKDRLLLEEMILPVFLTLINDSDFGGNYYSLTPGSHYQISENQYQSLVGQHLMFKSMASDRFLRAAGIAEDWPYGRGCYVSQDLSFMIWVGEEDHLRIMCLETGTLLNQLVDRQKSILDMIENIDGLEFAYSDTFGVVTSCPTNLGTSMRASIHLPLPHLTAQNGTDKLTALARQFGLSVRGAAGEHTPAGSDGTVDISPAARFCVTEAEIIATLFNGLQQLLAAESKAASTTH